MTVQVQRFDVSLKPHHGRPEVARFTSADGSLQVHCDRLSGSLWLFGKGPRGGDHGAAVINVRGAGRLLEWLDSDRSRVVPTTGAERPFKYATLHAPQRLQRVDGRSQWVREDTADEELEWSMGTFRQWRLRLDPAARDELLLCLREWATAAMRVAS